MSKTPSRKAKRSSGRPGTDRAKQVKNKSAAKSKPREDLKKRANWFQQRSGSRV